MTISSIRDQIARAFAILAARISTDSARFDGARIGSRWRTLAGVAVTPDTAVTVSTVWACLRYLSQTVGVLPWQVFRDGEDGAEQQPKHPVHKLLYKRPNPEWSSFQLRETLTHWALRWGNGWAEIERDMLGRPLALWPIHPDRGNLCRDTDTQRLFLEVDNGAGDKVEIDYQDIFHLRGFGEGVLGVNVITYAAESIGWAKAAQLFGSAFFGNGSNFSTVVVNKKGLTPAGKRKQREELDQLHKGPRNSHKSAIIDMDADIKQLGINAEQAQLVETHQHLVEEICRWFGVPPHKVMHLLRATFSNIEHQAIEVVVDSVSPWVKRFEDEADYKLFGANRTGFYSKMDLRALMRADVKTRAEYYKIMREIGAYSVNTILKHEDESTIGPDGDKRVMQAQYTTLSRIGEEPEGATVEPDQADIAALRRIEKKLKVTKDA